MIARIWRGTTPASKSDKYLDYLKATGVKDYLSTTGNCGVYVLRRNDGGLSEFFLISFWESFESIRNFAGPDIDRAVYYERDKEFLINLEPKVAHYEVLANRRG